MFPRIFRYIKIQSNFTALLVVLITSISFIFFYNHNFTGEPKSFDIMFLSGWDAKTTEAHDAKYIINKSATIAVFIPVRVTYKLSFQILFQNLSQRVEVYFNNLKIGSLKPKKSASWSKIELIIPEDMVRQGYNTFGFLGPLGTFETIGCRDISFKDYYSKGFYSLIVLSIVTFWLFYSLVFSRLSKIEYSKALSVDSLSYLISILTSISIYLIRTAVI